MKQKQQGDKRIVEQVKTPLTHNEIYDYGSRLAHLNRELIKLETDKAAAVAEYGASKKTLQADCADISLKIENGWEMRDCECLVVYSTPRAGMKRIIRMDLNETVRDEPMTPEEMQTNLDLGTDPNKKPQ